MCALAVGARQLVVGGVEKRKKVLRRAASCVRIRFVIVIVIVLIIRKLKHAYDLNFALAYSSEGADALTQRASHSKTNPKVNIVHNNVLTLSESLTSQRASNRTARG